MQGGKILFKSIAVKETFWEKLNESVWLKGDLDA